MQDGSVFGSMNTETGGWIAGRPCGSEPKLEFHLETVGADAASRLDAVERDLLRAAGLDPH